MRFAYVALLLLLVAGPSIAQKREEGFDFSFKPTTNVPRYYVVTQKKDSFWLRQAWYLPERGMAMEGKYRDEACTVPHGTLVWYHSNRIPKEQGAYVEGKKHGTWLRYDEEGHLRDSSNYEMGRPKGISMGWYADGMPSDSSNFDGAGRGVQVQWYEDGAIKSAGYLVNDTAKNGRWKYYHPNGKVQATEDYVNGDRKNCQCFDEQGKQRDPKECEEQDASFEGGEMGWRRFLERYLNPSVPLNNRAPLGMYTVMMRFIVEPDGTLSNFKPLTSYGYGMEEEVKRMLKKSPKWVPARQFGKNVKAYRIQPVTFVLDQG